MPSHPVPPSGLDHRLTRHLELLRGRLARLRGARVGARFGLGRGVRIVHPAGLWAGDDVTIAELSYVHCLSATGVRIGAGSSIDRNAWIHCGATPSAAGTGFLVLGERSYVGCNAVLGAGGGITIGRDVLIGQSVNMHAETHRFADRTRPIREQGVTMRGIVVGDDVWIGSRATILDGVTIGHGAVVGAGAVVTRSVAPHVVVAGVPARVIGERGRPAQ